MVIYVNVIIKILHKYNPARPNKIKISLYILLWFMIEHIINPITQISEILNIIGLIFIYIFFICFRAFNLF